MLWGNWKFMGGLGMFSIMLCLLILWLTGEIPGARSKQDTSVLVRPARSWDPPKTDECIKHYGGVQLNYVKGTKTAFTFDLCDVIKCGGKNSSWRGYDVYLCYATTVARDCQQYGWTRRSLCDGWSHVYRSSAPWEKDLRYEHREIVWWRRIYIQRDYSLSQNPITLGLDSIWGPPPTTIFLRKTGTGLPQNTHFHLSLQVEVSGKDPAGMLRINLLDPPAQPTLGTIITGTPVTGEIATPPPLPAPGEGGALVDKVLTQDFSQWDSRDLYQLATGFKETNLWLEWVTHTTREQTEGGCVSCAAARPQLLTEPAPLFPEDTWGFNCMISLFSGPGTKNCSILASIYPPVSNDTKTGPVVRGQGNFTCFQFNSPSPNGTIQMGSIDSSLCSLILQSEGSNKIGLWARAGLYFDCGGALRVKIPETGKGLCAMVRLAAPLVMMGTKKQHLSPRVQLSAKLNARRRRHVLNKRSTPSFDLTLNSPTYIDAVGVPRGVPDKHKLVNQVAAGFESIIVWVTVNKNVDRINYVHYNVMTLANLTRDAVEGLAEQLAPTSLMGVQNRMALDMLLAEKGGVCAMFGDMCCTFVPNNTAPDGSVTKALNGLRTLSETMQSHSGFEDPFTDWMVSTFGKWKNLVMSVLVSLAVFVAILVTCGCCCIPCIRRLSERLIERAVSEPQRMMMPLLGPEKDTSDAETDLDESP